MTDESLRSSVRSRLAGVAPHPRLIDVLVNAGRIILRGPISARDAKAVLREVERVPGVQSVRSDLTLLYPPRGRASGAESRLEYPVELARSVWPAGVRAGVAASGAFSLWLASKNRGATRLVLGALGVGLVTRAITNQSLAYLMGLFTSPVVHLTRTVEISASVEEAYEFWSRFENYALFMSYVESVEVNDRGGLHWKLLGPAGVRIEWDAQVEELIPNERIRWHSLPAARIQHSGDLRLEAISPQLSRVHVRLTYSPPAGAVGYAAAHFLGFDPRARIDDDLQIMKTLIEDQARSARTSGRLGEARKTPL